MHIICPNCGEQRSIDVASKHSVAVAVCLNCGEVMVIYKECAVSLDRRILTHGSTEEKRRHVAAMILEFVRHDRALKAPDQARNQSPCLEIVERQRTMGELPPINDREAEDFCRIDLNLIDKKGYFDRIFGKTAD